MNASLLLCCPVLRRYTSRTAASQFEAVLEAWETAAAAVLQREALLNQVLQLQTVISDCQQLQQQQQQLHRQSSTAAVDGAWAEDKLGLDVQQVRQVLWAFLAADQQVELAGQGLVAAAGQELHVGVCHYPLQESRFSVAQLLVEAWVATGKRSS